jgi:hypothetical protein
MGALEGASTGVVQLLSKARRIMNRADPWLP